MAGRDWRHRGAAYREVRQTGLGAPPPPAAEEAGPQQPLQLSNLSGSGVGTVAVSIRYRVKENEVTNSLEFKAVSS